MFYNFTLKYICVFVPLSKCVSAAQSVRSFFCLKLYQTRYKLRWRVYPEGTCRFNTSILQGEKSCLFYKDLEVYSSKEMRGRGGGICKASGQQTVFIARSVPSAVRTLLAEPSCGTWVHLSTL